MIKLHSKCTAPDYTEHGSVTTDCRTVGEFMTEAAAIFGGNLTIKVDGCRYDLFDNPKMRVTDNTPVNEVTYASAPGSMVFAVKTAPKPKPVKKSGWVNLYKTELGNYCIIGKVYGKKKACYEDPSRKEMIVNAEFVTEAKIEWEEVSE